MQIFLTGPTGFIGTAVVAELRAHGHTLAGLSHSQHAHDTLSSWGVTPVAGSLESFDVLAQAAQAADAVIHLGQVDGPGFPANDTQVVATFLQALQGTGKRLLYTSGAAVPGDTGDERRDESFPLDPASQMAWRGVTEQQVLAASADGIHGIAIRPTMVHGAGSLGMAGFFMQSVQRDGIARYIGTGEARWSTVHVADIADLYVRAIENAAAGQVFIAASDEVVQFRDLAIRTAGDASKTAPMPRDEAQKMLGLLADLMTMNAMWSGAKARQVLGWQPTGTTLLDELAQAQQA